MIRKRLPIIIIAIAAFIIVLVTYFAGTKTGLIKPLPTQVPATENISNVSVRNFEANPVQTNTENDSLIVDNEAYQITYVKQFNQFIITINNKDFDNTRKTAENAFVDNLKITKTDACKLNVYVTTTAFANPDQAGQQFPLSFCQK